MRPRKLNAAFHCHTWLLAGSGLGAGKTFSKKVIAKATAVVEKCTLGWVVLFW